VAQQFLAALATDWDGPLGALMQHLDQDTNLSTIHSTDPETGTTEG